MARSADGFGVAPGTLALAAAVLHLPVPERALLIGCGAGDPALFLSREFPAARVRGTDPSAALLRRAQARVGLDPEGRIAFKQASPRSLPYPDDFFDLVAQVDGRVVAAEVARVLRVDGYFVHVPTAGPRIAARAREGLRHAVLRRQGFVTERVGTVEDGKFTVARLGDRR